MAAGAASVRLRDAEAGCGTGQAAWDGPSLNRIDFATLGSELLNRAPALLNAWLPGGHFEGDEYLALNPTRGDHNTGSFKVNSRTGRWADFSSGGEGGDLTSLFAYLHGLSQVQAARDRQLLRMRTQMAVTHAISRIVHAIACRIPRRRASYRARRIARAPAAPADGPAPDSVINLFRFVGRPSCASRARAFVYLKCEAARGATRTASRRRRDETANFLMSRQ